MPPRLCFCWSEAGVKPYPRYRAAGDSSRSRVSRAVPALKRGLGARATCLERHQGIDASFRTPPRRGRARVSTLEPTPAYIVVIQQFMTSRSPIGMGRARFGSGSHGFRSRRTEFQRRVPECRLPEPNSSRPAPSSGSPHPNAGRRSTAPGELGRHTARVALDCGTVRRKAGSARGSSDQPGGS